MLNTRYVSDLIEKGDINQIKDAIEKSMAPGSQSFEQALMGLISTGQITQDEALENADSANNLLWMLNNNDKTSKVFTPESDIKSDADASFTEFTLNS